MQKFEKLKNLLVSNDCDKVVISESTLNELIEGGLSPNAFLSKTYFSNDPTHSIARAWMSCGYRCSSVNKENKTITLIKETNIFKKILSSDILYSHFLENKKPNYRTVVSPFTFAEICRSKNVSQLALKDYLLDINAIFIDFSASEVSFDRFYDIINYFGPKKQPLKYRMAKTYSDFVTYVFATCLVNIGDITADAIIDYFGVNPNLPITFFNDSYNKRNLRDSFIMMCNNIETNMSVGEIFDKLGLLNTNSMSRFMVESSPIDLLFYDYAVNNFIHCYQHSKEFIILPKMVEEMLNVELIASNKNLIYVTSYRFSKEILISSIKNRIEVIDYNTIR